MVQCYLARSRAVLQVVVVASDTEGDARGANNSNGTAHTAAQVDSRLLLTEHCETNGVFWRRVPGACEHHTHDIVNPWGTAGVGDGVSRCLF